MASRLGVGTGRGRSLTNGLMSSSSGRGFDEPDPTLWKLLEDCRTAMSPWTEKDEIYLKKNYSITPEPDRLGCPVLGDVVEAQDEPAPSDVLHLVHHRVHHHGLLHGLLQHPPHYCGGCQH